MVLNLGIISQQKTHLPGNIPHPSVFNHCQNCLYLGYPIDIQNITNPSTSGTQLVI